MFDRVVVTCPVKRLGSLMDLSPVVEGMGRFFAGRGAFFAMSRQAQSLWRHKLKAMHEEHKAVDFSALPSQIVTALMERQRVLGVPLADDVETESEAFAELSRISPNSATWVGCDWAKMAIKGLPADHHPLSFFRVLDHNLTPVPGKETPRPYVINSSVGIVQKAVQLDSGGVADGLQPKPHIWTSDREIEDAESFFAMMGLEPARAIGLHLTAGSGNVFHRMWRRESFIEVVKHFLEQHYQVVMMTGSTAFPLPRKENNPSWEDHLDFFATLKGRFPEHSDQIALFYGDVLVNAEIIRKCAVFLSGETGPAHLATAVGTPKVTIAATDFQAANWLFTGEGDFGYISQHDKHSRIIGPTVEEVVGGIETILRRKTKTMPVASE